MCVLPAPLRTLFHLVLQHCGLSWDSFAERKMVVCCNWCFREMAYRGMMAYVCRANRLQAHLNG